MNQFDPNQPGAPMPQDGTANQNPGVSGPGPNNQMPSSPPPSTPFEMPQGMNQPNPNDGIQPTQPPAQGAPNPEFQPTYSEPQGSGVRTWVLIGVLILLLAFGGLVFASYEGWINIGFLANIFGKKSTPTTTTTTTTAPKTTNDTTRKTDLGKIKDALKAYYQANQSYPVSAAVDKTNSSTSVLLVLVPTYLSTLPTDPIPTQYYGYKSDGKTFELTAVLDDTTDPSGIKSGNYYLYKITNSSTETPVAATSGSTGTSTSSTPTTSSGTTSTPSSSETSSGTASGTSSATSAATTQ